MASKKRTAKDSMNPVAPPTKLQKSVIHWVRKNVPTKKTKFLHSHVVEYFTGCKAVDALVNDSPWSKAKAPEGSELVFEFREAAVEFLDEMLKHKYFHRARKIPVMDKSERKKKGKKGEEKPEDTEKEDTEKEDKKKKRKIRLDMHLEQVFVDNQDAFVWLYDPIPWYYWLGGTCIVLGIIAICLFPLWPPMMRQGVHYLSVAAAGFLCLIIGLGILKYILFAFLFVVSGGKLKFWIFPNLTEDVGFFESFVPAYDYTYTGKSWRRKKAKDSDDEDEGDDEEENNDEKRGNSSESDDSTSKKSSTGKDFEMVEPDKNDTDANED